MERVGGRGQASVRFKDATLYFTLFLLGLNSLDSILKALERLEMKVPEAANPMAWEAEAGELLV